MTRYGSLGVELGGVLEAASGLNAQPQRILVAQQRATVTMRRRVGPEAKRDIGAEYNLQASRIAAGLRVTNRPDGISVVGSSKGVNAIEFGAQWTRVTGSGQVATISKRKFRVAQLRGRLRGSTGLGARYAIKRGKGPVVDPDTFIATGVNGARLVFAEDVNRAKQKYVKGRNAGRTKYPLRSIYGPSIAQMLKHDRRPERLAEFAKRVLWEDLQRQLQTR